MKSAPKFLYSSDQGEIYITHTQKPLIVCRVVMLRENPKAIEVIVSSGELPEEKRMEALKKRMLDWYIFKHHNKTNPML